jgi:hypothetical protein
MSWTLDDDFINEMEVLLLDTTQKESEDNFIYHYAFENVKENSFTSNRLIKIRGALATAARTCTTLCDEEITLLHLKNEQKQKDYTIGYIDLKETLFLMIFPSKIPHNIIQVKKSLMSLYCNIQVINEVRYGTTVYDNSTIQSPLVIFY